MLEFTSYSLRWSISFLTIVGGDDPTVDGSGSPVSLTLVGPIVVDVGKRAEFDK